MNQSPIFLIVDLFCGAGGTTTGFELANINGTGIAKVIACVNHDHKAIKSHWQNHPDVKHFEEDIRVLDLTELKEVVKWWQERYPDAYLVLWASLECTNFSKAKGGQPRDADSRTLADHLHRYIEALNPDYIQIENVVEFMSWGPLDEKGKPISKKNGQDYIRWKKSIDERGYYNDFRELNSANFGAFTSRNRLFICFARPSLPIIWPEATHAKNPEKATLFGAALQKWNPVKEKLQLEKRGASIFDRKKPLSGRTLDRIYAGLLKYVAKGDTAFLKKYYSGRPAGKVTSLDSPAGTIKTIDGQALVQTISILKYNSINGKTGIHNPPSIDESLPTITTQGRLGIVQGEFLQHHYGNGFTTSLDNPLPTITTKDRAALVQPEMFIDKHYGKSAQHQSIDQPAGTILPTDKHRLVQAVPFIIPTNYNNQPKSIEDPLQTITANRKRHYIVNPSHGGHSTSIEAPCPVIVARQDKAPLYLLSVEEGPLQVAVYEHDTEAMIRIKKFMVAFNIVDIRMRMLFVHELLTIQGFPDDYKLFGNQADQKKFIGNSVVPQVVKAWAEAMAQNIMNKQKLVA